MRKAIIFNVASGKHMSVKSRTDVMEGSKKDENSKEKVTATREIRSKRPQR